MPSGTEFNPTRSRRSQGAGTSAGRIAGQGPRPATAATVPAESSSVGALRHVSAAELLRAPVTSPMTSLMPSSTCGSTIIVLGRLTSCAKRCPLDETGRGLAFRALLRIGPAAADAVGGLRENPDLADFVTVFRVDTLAASPDEMDRAGDPEGWVRLLHTVLELWGPDAAVSAWAVPAAGAPGIEAMLETVWRIKGEHTEDVLVAVGGHHPDKRIAKAARRALFKHRSAG
jgi:hypothetical protein